ncbi:MAG TPA: solute-binding protein [Firmicutes bacterium]|nr:solute-binding protein [Bacillota bacterium]
MKEKDSAPDGKRSRRRLRLVAAVALLALVAGRLALGSGAARTGELVVATGTTLYDTGLLDYLVPLFEEQSGLKVKVVAVGTGAALELGRKGDADVLLTHSPAAEEEFVAEGYGTGRYEVMYNDFVLIGPAADPVKLRGLPIVKAFRAIAKSRATFLSRGDRSGTHLRELALWRRAGLAPGSPWYVEAGTGMGNLLLMAGEKQGYALADRGTFLAFKHRLKLTILVSGDPALRNQYAVIPVNPKKFPRVNYQGAQAFAAWLTSPAAQDLIGRFGADRYGEPLFTPNARTRQPRRPGTPALRR